MSTPPSPGGGGGGVGGGSPAFSPAVVAVIAVLGSAFLIVSYYRIFAKLCTRWQNRRAVRTSDLESQLHGEGNPDVAAFSPTHGLDKVLIKKIPIFEYKRGDGFTAETECPVCLMEFVDKQDLRMLPKCAHAFHIDCVDTWLNTHSTCPLCRANVFSEQVMSQYPHPLSPPQLNFFGTPLDGGFSTADYSRGDYGNRYNGQGRSPQPTLRGLLSFEDHQQAQPPIRWVPHESESGRPDGSGEDSLRLYNSRDYGGVSSARHHGLVIPGPTSFLASNAPPSTDPLAEKDRITRTASFKEVQRSRSRDHAHRWHFHAARRSARRNPFASVRSFSMGTSRRLINALEFLDLEGLRSSNDAKGADKLYSPYDYGIMETPDYHPRATVPPADFPSPSGDRATDFELRGTGESSSEREEWRHLASSLPDNNPGGDSSAGATLKSWSRAQVKGRSLSFRSTSSLKRSLSGGMNMFSLRYTGKGNRVSSSPTFTSK